MAKKSSELSYREVLSEIKKKKFAPVYILMGEEPYYIDLLADALIDNVVDEDDRDFNCEIYYGSDTDISVVAGAAQQFPVMAERKLVMLKEAQSMVRAKSQLEKIAPYLENHNSSTVLVIIYKGENIPATSPLMKAAAKASDTTIVFKSPKIRDYNLAGHLRDYCASKGLGIDDKAASILCEYIGSPLSKLFGEVDKLKVAIGERSRITPQDIEDNIGISKDFNNFELIAAIADKNYPKAMMITRYFRKNPKQNPTVLSTALIFDFFAKLCMAHFSADKSDGALYTLLELKNSKALGDCRTGMARYNATQAVKAVHSIRDFDTKSKGIGSLQNEYDLLDELIFNLMTQ